MRAEEVQVKELAPNMRSAARLGLEMLGFLLKHVSENFARKIFRIFFWEKLFCATFWTWTQ